ncbi:hypothetical protein ABZ468_24455 [Streptomyces sp. NPDC005708]|uniref:MmyB family transcriptional regulator n=1 Tax=unclassified Streptomyces TaxID=2593676 RepID=UPI0033D897B8
MSSANSSPAARTSVPPGPGTMHYSGLKHFHHPVVGDLTLAFDAMQLPAEPSLSLTVMSAEPGSSDADALELRASWAATEETLPVDVLDPPAR